MLVQKDEDKLLKRLLNASDRERNSAKKKQAAELKKAEKRKTEVDGLFSKMYEAGLPEIYVNSENTMAVGNIDKFKGHGGSALHGVQVAAGRAEAAVTAERDEF